MSKVESPEDVQGARRILLAASLLLCILHFHESRSLMAGLLSPSPAPRGVPEGPFAKYADSIGYYAWLRSGLIDGDFQFENEFAAWFARDPEAETVFGFTATGHRRNHWPVGPALLWAPAAGAVHLTLLGLGGSSPWPANGYSPPYSLAVGITTLAWCILGLWLVYRIAARFVPPVPAAVGAAMAALATPFVAYCAVDVSMAHGAASGVLALFAFTWLRSFGNQGWGRWALVGGLVGLAGLMRWQLVTFGVLLGFEAAWTATRTNDRRVRFRQAALLSLAGAAAFVVFTPQLAAKWIVYGDPLGGMHKTAQNWLEPSLWTVLASREQSLLAWSPVMLVAIAGLWFLATRHFRIEAPMLGLAVLLQVYTVSALLGGEAYLGWSFGFRILTETCLITAPGIAWFVHFQRGRPHTVGFACFALIAWNLLLLGVFRHCVSARLEGYPHELLPLVGKYVRLRPLEAGLMVGLAAAMATVVRVSMQATKAKEIITGERLPERRWAA